MIKAFATGYLGKDAEVKTFGENSVTTFSIASTKKIKGEDVTTWLNCQKWNSDKLAPYLLKGTKLEVSGDLEIKKHEDKYYTTLNVWELEFGGKVSNGETNQQTNDLPPEPQDDEAGDLPF